MFATLFRSAAALVGGASGSQFSAFYDQYLHEVAARLRQAREGLTHMSELAERTGMPLHELLRQLRDKGEVGRAAFGDLSVTYEALLRLEPAYRALSTAGLHERPFVFALHVDPALAETVWRDYHLVLPVGTAGVTYTAAGLLLGLVLAWCCERPLAALRKRRRHPQASEGR